MFQWMFPTGSLISAALIALVWFAGPPARAAELADAPRSEHAPSGQAARDIVPAQAPAAPAPNVEARLTQLRQQLQITPAQQSRFAAFADVMRANSRMAPPTQQANPSAVDDLRLAIQGSQEELGALQRLLPTLQALYASLSPAQQKIADRVFRQGAGE
jgi:LTXXQ motif family protein